MAMEWRDLALCQEVGTDIFFPEKSEAVAAMRARSVCARCEVKVECLAAGMDEEHGIWGGLTAVERRQLRKRKAVA